MDRLDWKNYLNKQYRDNPWAVGKPEFFYIGDCIRYLADTLYQIHQETRQNEESEVRG